MLFVPALDLITDKNINKVKSFIKSLDEQDLYYFFLLNPLLPNDYAIDKLFQTYFENNLYLMDYLLQKEEKIMSIFRITPTSSTWNNIKIHILTESLKDLLVSYQIFESSLIGNNAINKIKIEYIEGANYFEIFLNKHKFEIEGKLLNYVNLNNKLQNVILAGKCYENK